METRHSDMLVIDQFPHGCPGAPVPGMNQGSSTYEATRNTLGDSVWAPFRSQCDWEVAHWAKMRGPSSSAVTELLAIPEVRNCNHTLTLHNQVLEGCRKAWFIVQHQQQAE